MMKTTNLTTKALCPVCKKHTAIITERPAVSVVHGETVEFKEVVYFCSALGASDPDSFFATASAMEENLSRAQQAYRKLKRE